MVWAKALDNVDASDAPQRIPEERNNYRGDVVTNISGTVLAPLDVLNETVGVEGALRLTV